MATRLAAGLLLALTLTSGAASTDIRTVALSGDPAPGGTPGATFENFIEIALNDAGQVAFRAEDTDDQGIWSERSGTLALEAHVGGPAPWNDGEADFYLLRDLRLSDSGTTFLAVARGDNGGVVGIWTEHDGTLGLAVDLSGAAPGTPDGVAFRSSTPGTLVSNNLGQTAFLASVTGTGVDSTNRNGIWSVGSGALHIVARAGDPAPDTDDGVDFSFLSHPGPVLNDTGQTAFRGVLIGEGVDTTNDEGIWAETSGTLRLVARAGDPVSGVAEGHLFDSPIGPPVINNAGQTAFVAGLNDTKVDGNEYVGIWSEGSGELKLVVRDGDPVPGAAVGAKFRRFDPDNLVMNGAGRTAFQTTVLDHDDSFFQGIWSDASGDLDLVAREGDPAPGTTPGVNFLQFSIYPLEGVPVVPHLNGNGQTAFSASLTGAGINNTNAFGIWAESFDGELTLIAREGDPIEIRPGDVRIIRTLSFGNGSGNEDGRNSLFNERGQLAFGATFTDGTSGIFVSNAVAVPEPASLGLLLAGAVLLIGLRSRS